MYQRVYAVTRLLLLSARDDMTLERLNPIPSYTTSVQFLHWGQNQAVNTVYSLPFPDAPPYSPAAFAVNQDVPATTAAASTQIVRQTSGQVVSRGRGYELTPTGFSDHGSFAGEGSWAEGLGELYQRALVAKREAQVKRKQIPPFVQKLSSFLNESKNTDLIRWSDNGNSFIVLDEDEFAKILILELFKHNNYASFVRNKSGKGNVRVKTEDADDHEHDDYDDATGALRDERARNRELSLVQSVR
ncbi:hypothetical protein EMGR_004688 [Emarellia grisea]